VPATAPDFSGDAALEALQHDKVLEVTEKQTA
jgi:hypothetical protein